MSKISLSEVNNVQSTVREIQSAAGGNGSQYLNSIFEGIASAEAIANGEHEQKVAGIKALIASLMTFLVSLVANSEKSKAKNDVDSNSSSINNSQNKSEALKEDVNTRMEEIGGVLEEQNGNITKAQEEIENAQQEMEVQQAIIEAELKLIQEKQQELLSTTDNATKIKLLNEIQSASSMLSTAIGIVTGLQTIIAAASTQVEKATELIQEAQGNSIKVQEYAQGELEQIASEAQKEAVTEGTTQVTAGINTTTSATAGAAAATASSNIITASAAPKLYKVANDQGSAAAIRIKGSAKNIKKIVKLIGKIGDNNEILNTFSTLIGSKVSNYNNLIGTWNSTLEPLITSIGSMQEIDTSELDSAVTTDLATVSAEDSSDTGHVTNTTPKNTQQQPSKGSYDRFTNSDNQNSSSWDTDSQEGFAKETTELLTPKVKIKAPEFGV